MKKEEAAKLDDSDIDEAANNELEMPHKKWNTTYKNIEPEDDLLLDEEDIIVELGMDIVESEMPMMEILTSESEEIEFTYERLTQILKQMTARKVSKIFIKVIGMAKDGTPIGAMLTGNMDE
jgi:hypothetical protein